MRARAPLGRSQVRGLFAGASVAPCDLRESGAIAAPRAVVAAMSSQPFAHLHLERLQHFFFRPSRPLLGAALDVARDSHSPAEAWEAMASRGIIPPDWAPHDTRCFVPDDDEGEVVAGWCPPTRSACVAFASDAAGVVTAESLAWELAARLAVWGVARPRRVCWRVGPRVHPLSLRSAGFAPVVGTLRTLVALWSASPRQARYALRDRSSRRREAREALREDRTAQHDALLYGQGSARLCGLADELSHLAALWDFATREFLHISKLAVLRNRLPGELVGVRVGAMRSPVEPLVALYGLGYGLGPLTAETLTLTAVEPAID